MTVLVLDDDPTGTQCASDVPVLLRPADLGSLPHRRDRGGATGDRWPSTNRSAYVLTNTRAMSEADAAALVRDIRDRAGPGTELVLRGDSTLRGHVFAEMAALGLDRGVGLIVPAFPAAGRITVGGVHYLEIRETRVNTADTESARANVADTESSRRNLADAESARVNTADTQPACVGTADNRFALMNVADTEFARDPVFGFTARTLRDWVAELGGQRGFASVAPQAAAVRDALLRVPDGGVVVPDVLRDADLQPIADGLAAARAAGRHIVVRCAAPFAALLAGVHGRLVPAPPDRKPGLLIVCGSHTRAATAQLAALTMLTEPHLTLPTEVFLETAPSSSRSPSPGLRPLGLRLPTPVWADVQIGPSAAAHAVDAVVAAARAQLATSGVTVVTTERVRRAEHGRLTDGAAIMAGLTQVARQLAPHVGAIVTKGGITSAEVATNGLGGTIATVLGQVETGVPLWDVAGMPVAVVPGNIGDAQTLVRMLHYFGAG